MLGLLIALQTPVFVHASTAEYRKLELHGFQVYVSPAALQDKDATSKALGLLESKLSEVVRIVPAAAVAKLKSVKLWVERDNPGNPGAVYHPSATWLAQNKYNTDKEKSVEIGNVRNFVDWSTRVQPMMVLHELAHAFHHQVAGYDHQGIASAFASAVGAKSYENVMFVSGGEKRHYALSNSKEYFAEISEAYFGYNDFFPFDRFQLIKHDRQGFEALVSVWGHPSGQSHTIGTSATPDVLKSVGRYRVSP